MKKNSVVFVFFLLLFSCNFNNWNDTIIKNDSDFSVTFKFNNTGSIVLPAGEQATFPTKAHQRLESYAPDKRVSFSYLATNDGYTGNFSTRKSWTVNVNNAIGQEATLDADGWMDSIVNIPAGNQSDIPAYQGKVYTDNPQFTVATGNFPAVAVYSKDSGSGDFFVTIQWSSW